MGVKSVSRHHEPMYELLFSRKDFPRAQPSVPCRQVCLGRVCLGLKGWYIVRPPLAHIRRFNLNVIAVVRQ